MLFWFSIWKFGLEIANSYWALGIGHWALVNKSMLFFPTPSSPSSPSSPCPMPTLHLRVNLAIWSS
ncbi:MAG: hypothetical protein V7K27_07630 [Nostoc sp.]|uniref:hypothetical protein n=1 Tax=Nostoc sp. TaxID=1180 RepID=UPI002FF777FF